MAAEGIASPFDIVELSILGLFEGVRALPRVRRRARETADMVRRERPDVAILIDSWGFSLRVAHRLRAANPDLLIVKYVAPQVWASRPGRAKTLARSVDHLLSINPLDVSFFEPEGLASTFVGNPALAREHSSAQPDRLRRHIGAGENDPILLIAPGSRPSEIARITEPFQKAARILKDRYPGLRIVAPISSTVATAMQATVSGWPEGTILLTDVDLKRDAMSAATVALACSGTVTLELAMASCPVVVGYRLGTLTYAILIRLLTTRYITLFNIAAGEEIAPEFVQGRCTAENLAAAVGARLDDPALRTSQIERQNAALKAMGRGLPDPSEQAADTILSLLAERADHDVYTAPAA